MEIAKQKSHVITF